MYIEMPSAEEFKTELKERKIKEARIASYFIQSVDKDVGSVTSFRIVLSANGGKEVIKCIEILGWGVTANQEDMKKLSSATKGREELIKKTFLKEKIVLKAGEWKDEKA